MTSLSRSSCACGDPPVDPLLDEPGDVLHQVEHPFEVVLRYRERWLELQDVAADPTELAQQSVLDRKAPCFGAHLRGRLFRRLVQHEVDADEQTGPADVPDGVEPL